jgi:hypothetical protein
MPIFLFQSIRIISKFWRSVYLFALTFYIVDFWSFRFLFMVSFIRHANIGLFCVKMWRIVGMVKTFIKCYVDLSCNVL